MRKTMMLALRQKLTISSTSQAVADTTVAACLHALPQARPATAETGTRTELLSHVTRGLLAGAAALFLCLSIFNAARADEHAWQYVGTMENDDPYAADDDIGSIDCFYDRKDPTSTMLLVHYKNGYEEQIFSKDEDAGNPNPEDPSSGPKGDISSSIALGKQKGGGNQFAGVDFWKTPLGQRLGAGGNGPGPVINPSDDSTGQAGARNPSLGKEKLGAPEIFNKYGQAGSGKGGGFQFNGGSPADQLKTHGPGSPPGSSSRGNGDDKGSHGQPPGSNYGPAELVDPLGPPIARRPGNGTTNGIGTVTARFTTLGVVQRLGHRSHYKVTVLGTATHKRLGGPDTKAPKVAKISTTGFRAFRTSNTTPRIAVSFVRRPLVKAHVPLTRKRQ